MYAIIAACFAALVGWYSYHIGYQHGSQGQLTAQTQLAACNSKAKSLKALIDEHNKLLEQEKKQLDEQQRKAKLELEEANLNASKAAAKANAVLNYRPGDDYTLASLEAIKKSIEK